MTVRRPSMWLRRWTESALILAVAAMSAAATATAAQPPDMVGPGSPQPPAGSPPPPVVTGTLPAAAPGPPPAKAWQITPSVELQEIFTDNVYAGGGPKASDMLTATTPALAVTGDSRNVQLRFDGNYTYDKYLINPRLDGGMYSASGNAQANLWDKVLLVDWRSAVDVQPVDPQGAHSLIPRTLDSNQTEVINSSISPYLQRDFGGFARGEVRYRLSIADFASLGSGPMSRTNPALSASVVPAPANTLTNEISYSLDSGSSFNRMSWGLDGSESRTEQSGAPTTQTSNTVSSEYKVIRQIGVIGRFGYESMTSTVSEAPAGGERSAARGIIWRIGPRLTPGPRTTITLEYGRRYNGTYWSGSAQYKISADSTLNLTHDVTTTTQQQQLNANLNQLTVGPDGSLVGSGNPNQLSFPFTNQVYVDETTRLALSRERGRNTLQFSGSIDQRRVGAIDLSQPGTGRQMVMALDTNLGHKMTPMSEISVGVDLMRSFDNGGPANYRTAQAQLSYTRQLSRVLQGTLIYMHSQQDNVSLPDVSENMLVIGLKRQL